MKKLAIILFSLGCICTSAQEKKCTTFKVGTFKYSNPLYADWIIKRTETAQVETNKKTGLIIHNEIKWLSECEFDLICTKVSQTQLQHVVGKVFHIQIIETSNSSYTCISRKNEVQDKDMTLEVLKL